MNYLSKIKICLSACSKIVVPTAPAVWILVAVSISFSFGVFDNSFQTAILTGTGILIAWYSWETYCLRKEMSQQNLLQEMPIVTPCLAGAYLELHNVGDLPAYDIHIDPIYFLEYKLDFDDKSKGFLLKSGNTIEAIGSRNHTNVGGHISTRFNDLATLQRYLRNIAIENGEEKFADAYVDLRIHFKNMLGKKFTGYYRIGTPNPYLDRMEISLVRIQSDDK